MRMMPLQTSSNNNCLLGSGGEMLTIIIVLIIWLTWCNTFTLIGKSEINP